MEFKDNNKQTPKKPILVKVKHKDQIFYIFTDEFDTNLVVKTEIAKILNEELDNIKLYFHNKRVISFFKGIIN